MTTSNTIQYISKLLNEPQTITNADLEKFQSLTEAYPYFLPSRYIGAAYMQKNDPFGPKMMTNMHLYAANWILFCEFLNKVAENPHKRWGTIPSSGIIEPEPVKPKIEKRESTINTIATLKNVGRDILTNERPGEPGKNTVNNPARSKMNDILEKFSLETVVPPYEKEPLKETDHKEEQEEDIEFDEHEEIKSSPDDLPFDEHMAQDADEPLILHVYTEDYFLQQGIPVSNEIPADIEEPVVNKTAAIDKSLMVVMSFTDWLAYFKSKNEKEKSETEDKKALKTMWQKEKLAAATGEENEEIPEGVFEMAVNSITMEEGLVSEALAEINEKQGKYDKAIEMYRKLSLRNPHKNSYFAAKIEALLKERNS